MNGSRVSRATPKLPALARIPLVLVPIPILTIAITAALNAVFAPALREGDLGFLADRVLNVHVSDAALEFSIRLDHDRLRSSIRVARPDLTIEGTVYTFLLLATRREDADTLFFHRQLKMSGDTELGLYVKNFLDGLEREEMPYHRAIEALLERSIELADRFDAIMSRLPTLSGTPAGPAGATGDTVERASF